MRSSQSGFGFAGIIVIVALAGGAYLMKDDHGVSYLERGYEMTRYYLFDRNQEALEAAKGAHDLLQGQQDALQRAVDEQ